MTPILYSAAETAFASNGLGRLTNCIECVVTEERNGVYECRFSYPINGVHYAYIDIGCYIGATHDDAGDVQPFEIYAKSAPIDGIVTFYARHLSYKLSNIIVDPFTASNISDALAGFTTENINTNPFTFWTDKTTIAPFEVPAPSSVRGVMGGVAGSILDVYGGEYEFDKWVVKLHASRGTSSGVTIRYAKNLSNLVQDKDAGGIYNAVVPYWRSEVDGTVVLVTLPEKMVTATGVTNPRPVVLDLSTELQDQPTEAELRAAAQAHLADKTPWLATENIKVDFVQLWQTTEYAGVANLQRVKLCDTVDVIYTALGVTAHGIKVIKTVYDVLANKYSSIELGTPQASFGDVISADTSAQLQKTQGKMQGFFDTAIKEATDLLTGANGGHVVIKRDANGEPQEILIMDTDSELTATNILRINLNGIGFSTDGGSSYTTAWTINGAFVADFITTGTLRAIMIEGPTADTFWNLTSGVFQSSGVHTLTGYIETAEGVITPITYDVTTKTRLDGGELTVVGHKTGETDTVFTDAGLQSNDLDYDFYEQLPGDIPNSSLAYPHGGLIARGSRITSFGGAGDNQHDTDVDNVDYNPRGELTPDYLELGRVENPTFADGVMEGQSYPHTVDRNILRVSGGWVERREAILFKKYYDHFQDYIGHARDYHEAPIICRPAWDIVPGETVTISTVYLIGLLNNAKTQIFLSLPLARPFSEDVQSVTIAGKVHSRQGSTVQTNNTDFDSGIDGTGYDYAANFDISKDCCLSFRLHKWDNSWSGTGYGLCFVTLSNVEITAYDYDVYA